MRKIFAILLIVVLSFTLCVSVCAEEACSHPSWAREEKRWAERAYGGPTMCMQYQCRSVECNLCGEFIIPREVLETSYSDHNWGTHVYNGTLCDYCTVCGYHSRHY